MAINTASSTNLEGMAVAGDANGLGAQDFSIPGTTNATVDGFNGACPFMLPLATYAFYYKTSAVTPPANVSVYASGFEI